MKGWLSWLRSLHINHSGFAVVWVERGGVPFLTRKVLKERVEETAKVGGGGVLCSEGGLRGEVRWYLRYPHWGAPNGGGRYECGCRTEGSWEVKDGEARAVYELEHSS
ncbi:hypothetical protein Tco_1406277 [Tanacetum coccineum]